MNKRIRALADEAEDYADGIVDAGGEFHPAYTRKLAELIVRECMGIAEENQPRDVDWNISDIIRVHFGVEK